MKKTFPLKHPTIHPDRLVEAAKGHLSKYLKRERKKRLPENVDFWDFDCAFGTTESDAKAVHVAELPKQIEKARAEEWAACYIRVLAKPGIRRKKS